MVGMFFVSRCQAVPPSMLTCTPRSAPTNSSSRMLVVLLDGPHDGVVRKVAADRRPGPAAVTALEQMGRVVAALVVVGGDDHDVGIVL